MCHIPSKAEGERKWDPGVQMVPGVFWGFGQRWIPFLSTPTCWWYPQRVQTAAVTIFSSVLRSGGSMASKVPILVLSPQPIRSLNLAFLI